MRNKATFNQILDVQFLKIYRRNDEEPKSSIYSNYSSPVKDKLLSLDQILEKYSRNRSYLVDKVFEIGLNDDNESAEFRYVHLKVNQVKGKDHKIRQVI